ncbi:SCO family protein [Sphingomicrobium nitratireducens]|uniref:SCO family protein n=1 Tax=Sphingomicrobium nitratireducens TaxID=2964666 RepID=UPI00223EA3A6|nr:SCO family protein [Sphingomicrobium nitratireducens]
MRRLRLALWALVGLVAAGMAAFIVTSKPPAPRMETRPADDYASTIGGPFTLVDSAGEPFSSTRLAGRPYAIFFGFTHCPDVCPTTLARLVGMREELGADSFDIVFVSVDPARDGPEEIGKYGKLFETPIIGLTGSQVQIDKVKKQFGVFSEKVGTAENYNVDHTASVFLMDVNGQFVATIAPEESRETALAKLRRIAG